MLRRRVIFAKYQAETTRRGSPNLENTHDERKALMGRHPASLLPHPLVAAAIHHVAEVLPHPVSFKHILQLWLAASQRGLRPPDEDRVKRLRVHPSPSDESLKSRDDSNRERSNKVPKNYPYSLNNAQSPAKEYGGMAIRKSLTTWHSNLSPLVGHQRMAARIQRRAT